MSDSPPVVVETAHALRVVRMLEKENVFRFYTGVTFPAGAWDGCELYVRRCWALGYLKDGEAFTLDVLDESGDVAQDFPLTKKGFEYLRQKLNFRVEREED